MEKTGPKPERDEAPYGLEPLRAVPRLAFLAAALIGAGLLAAAAFLSGPALGLALLAAVALLDLAQAGLRPMLLRLLRTRWKGLLLAGLLAAALVPTGLWGLRRQLKATAVARASLAAEATVRETAGIARRGEIAVLGLGGRAPDPGRLPPKAAVYDGLRRLPASLLLEGLEARLVVAVDLAPHQQKQLELYFGAEPGSDAADPEEAWSLEGGFHKAMGSIRWSVAGAESPGQEAAFLGRSFLRVEAQPVPGLPDALAALSVPVPRPAVLTADTFLMYAIRQSAPSSLAGSVQLETDRGPLWRHGPLDQDGLPAGPWTDLGGRALGRWYLRRIPLSGLAGAVPRSVALNIALPEGKTPQAAVFDFDAVRLTQGPALEAKVSELRPMQVD
jgi:hypothetical protein